MFMQITSYTRTSISFYKRPVLYVGILQGNADLLDVVLYNITADPEERHDLSNELPDVLKEMKDRMNYYLNTTVPAVYKPADPNALKEARKNGIWGPWM